MLTEELKQKIEFYEKYYFSLDDPVPFRNNIMIYPVKVKDYYNFYSTLPCLTMDKNVKTIEVQEYDEILKTEKTVLKQVSNPLGMSMSYMAYLCEMMKDKAFGKNISTQVMNLMEMVLHIKNGIYCPNCHNPKADLTFNDIFKHLRELETDEERKSYWETIAFCPECGQPVRDVYSIKDNGRIKKFCIGDYECSPKDFDELIAIICHMNILGYDDDEYIDPDLKADLDLKKKLQNQDFHSPTLEKQIGAVSVSTGILPNVIKEEFTIRRLSFMLKLVDSSKMYYAMKQGEFSGMVSFKSEPQHWIYSQDNYGRDASKELLSTEQLQKKFENIT